MLIKYKLITSLHPSVRVLLILIFVLEQFLEKIGFKSLSCMALSFRTKTLVSGNENSSIG
jgi:hypothetical protein